MRKYDVSASVRVQQLIDIHLFIEAYALGQNWLERLNKGSLKKALPELFMKFDRPCVMKTHEKYCTTIYVCIMSWNYTSAYFLLQGELFKDPSFNLSNQFRPSAQASMKRRMSINRFWNLLGPVWWKHIKNIVSRGYYSLKWQKCIFFTSGRAFQGSFIQSFQSVSPQRTGFNEEKDVNQPWDSYSCWYIIFPHQYTTTTWNGINVSNLSG